MFVGDVLGLPLDKDVTIEGNKLTDGIYCILW